MELEGTRAPAAWHAFSKTENPHVSLRQCLSLGCSVQSVVLVVVRCAGMNRGKEMQLYLCLEDLNWLRKKDRPSQLL